MTSCLELDCSADWTEALSFLGKQLADGLLGGLDNVLPSHHVDKGEPVFVGLTGAN